MAYSFTEKKRIRKDFGKLPGVLEVPYLLAIQLDSYLKFLQAGASPEERRDEGLHAAEEANTLGPRHVSGPRCRCEEATARICPMIHTEY